VTRLHDMRATVAERAERKPGPRFVETFQGSPERGRPPADTK
jgi:hypothetical protein